MHIFYEVYNETHAVSFIQHEGLLVFQDNNALDAKRVHFGHLRP